MVKKFILPICILILIVCTACKFQHTIAPPEEDNFNKIRGWSILSDNEENALRVIEAANDYMINHLQLSHDIVWDLKDIKNEQKRGLVNKLINYAHDKGIPEVTVWDHALYSLDYYPDEFKTGPEGTINLDNEEFWEWLKEDYRIMLDLIPRVNGIILTFIETGARVEEQYSAHLLTPADKLAKVIDEIAEVVVNERKLKLYARTFIYTREERNNILNCIDKIKNEDVILMVKEVPHDFFLTHPVQLYVSRLKRPVLIEFDAGHEYSGQGIIANTFVEKTAERWRFYQHEPNVTGYVARTDRYGTTSIIDRPSEILLYVLYIMNMEPKISCEQIYNDFITLKYGKGALPHIKHAFENAYEIVTSSIYTLGLCMANHSTLSCDYQSIYNRFVSGRWMENPVVRIEHAVNKEFHYYKDVVNHLAPKHLKEPGARLFIEDPFIYDSSWVNPEELMNKEYLGYIVSEKDYGVRLSVEALQSIEKAEPFVTRSEFQDLYQTFYRTLVKARLSRGTAKAYFSYRIMSAYPSVNDSQLLDIFWEGIHEMNEMAEIIKHQFTDSPQGEWTWINELRVLENYVRLMTKDGWVDYGSFVIRDRNIINNVPEKP